jgi:hypothetical protein
VVGAAVVAVAGDVSAWAGTMTASTTGFSHRSGNNTAPAAAPIIAFFKTRRRADTDSRPGLFAAI